MNFILRSYIKHQTLMDAALENENLNQRQTGISQLIEHTIN